MKVNFAELGCQRFFSSKLLFWLYKGLTCSCLEYFSHIWSGSSSVYLFDRDECKAIRYQLSHFDLKNWPTFSLLYCFSFPFFFIDIMASAWELAACLPPALTRPFNTQHVISSCDCCVVIRNSVVGYVCLIPLSFGTFSCFSLQI